MLGNLLIFQLPTTNTEHSRLLGKWNSSPLQGLVLYISSSSSKMNEHMSKMMVAIPLQASQSCTTTLAAKLEKRMLNVVQRQKDDNASAGIPEIHGTPPVGRQLRCSSSIIKLGSLHCRSLVTQQKLCCLSMLEFRQSWVQCLHYGLFYRPRLTG